MSFSHHPASRGGVAGRLVVLLGLVIFFFGLFFLYNGAQLARLGGSWYYVLCGIPLTLSGVFLMRLSITGAWLYYLTWIATIPWTIYDVGFDYWGWLPRLFGPTLVAIAVFVSTTALKKYGRSRRHV